jgi:hypothetical protein
LERAADTTTDAGWSEQDGHIGKYA